MPAEQISVPTFKVPSSTTKSLDTKNLSEEDLKILHDEDPFMYYSINKLRIAAIIGSAASAVNGNNDDARLGREARQGGSTADANGAPSPDSTAPATTVLRKTRLSFEVEACYSMVMELGLPDNVDDDEDDASDLMDDADDDEEDEFMFMAALNAMRR